jgi:transposase
MARVSFQLSVAIASTLQEIIRSGLFGATFIRRARCIALAHLGENYSNISAKVGLSTKTVSQWVRRFVASLSAFGHVEKEGVKALLMRSVVDCLRDAPRSGAPKTFGPAQVASIISIACEDPNASNRPVTTWTAREIASETVLRKIVDTISTSQVQRFLNDVQLRPQDNKGWCFTTEKDQELFNLQAQSVCDAYIDAPRLLAEEDICTVCVDEMTSLQANEKRAPTKRAIPGHCGKEECQYTRHGTICLTGNWDVVRGQFLLPTIEETRNNKDFSLHIKRLIQTDIAKGWVFVVDNLNTHCGEPLVRMVAEHLGISGDDLGEVAKNGVLKDMASRRAFLSDTSHLVRFVYIPKHSSWLNQIEAVFRMINRRVMRCGSFTSKEELVNKLRAFTKYFNETIAKPMKWTFTGRPTEKEAVESPKTWRELWPFRHLKSLLQKPEGTSGF